MIISNRDKEIDEVLHRGVAEFVDPDGKFREKLNENPEKVVIKFGLDPTRPDIHLGHAVVLRGLRKLQDLGCKVVFLVGDFTALIGDPTGKSKTRPEVSQGEVEQNMKTYLEQAGRILRTEAQVFSWIRNSDWFLNITDLIFPAGGKAELKIKKGNEEMNLPIDANSFIGKALAFEQSRMQVKDLGIKERVSVVTLRSFLTTLKSITHARLIERDMFQERIKSGGELYMHEMMYPVLQGIDSSVLATIYGSCDCEVGGSDQMFNMLVGRDVMKANGQEQQAVLSWKLLTGTDGKEKMSKSLDNYVGINEEPEIMFGKIMSIPDELIVPYFEMCTYTPLPDVQEIEKGLASGKLHPKEAKEKLAKEIVETYHGSSKARDAAAHFSRVFSEGGIPENLPEFEIGREALLIDVLVESGAVPSKSEARRLIDSGAIENIETGEKMADANAEISESLSLRIGKKRFLKILVK